LTLERFHPTGGLYAGSGALRLPAPSPLTPGDVHGGVFWVVEDHNRAEFIDARRFSALRFGGGYSFARWGRAEVELPVFPEVVLETTTRATLGDARIAVLLPVGIPAISVALRPVLSLPTGAPESGTGAGGLGGGGQLAVGGALGRLGWRLAGGAEREPSRSDLSAGAGLTARIGRHAHVGAEILGRQEVGAEEWVLESDLHGGLDRVGPGHILWTAGAGLQQATGTPLYRIGLGYGVDWSAPTGPMDSDRDGLADGEDDCPAAPEDIDDWADGDGCPDPDDDMDGIPDTADACPRYSEDLDGFEDADGCPEIDNDGDGLLDAEDACPDEVGAAATGGCPDADSDGVADALDDCPDRWGSAAAFGCLDRDGDRVPDTRDACPDAAADFRADPRRSDGCPSLAFLSEMRIIIVETVHFATGLAAIEERSHPLLMDVARVVKENPDLTLVEISGHTDATGPDDFNLKLSLRRATAVRAFLIERGGIDPERLLVAGYGEALPVESNLSDDGRGRNRRVEFLIQQMAPDSMAPDSLTPDSLTPDNTAGPKPEAP